MAKTRLPLAILVFNKFQEYNSINIPQMKIIGNMYTDA
jgi:hypothetical protein